MSYSADETYAVYDEQFPTARKLHVCDACKEEIQPGNRYARVGIVASDGAETVKRCMRCQRIHEHLRELCRDVSRKYGDDMWPEERLNCGERYEDEWGPTPDEIAALAFALPGEVK